MSFVENAAGEIVGGVVGGLVTLFAVSLWRKFRTFQLHYLDPKDCLTAEHISEYTAVRTDKGRCYFRLRLRPRVGLRLEKYSFAFFDKGKLPWTAGRRRSTHDAIIYKACYFNSHTQQFHDANLKVFEQGSYTEQPLLSLSGGSCAYFELYAEIGEALQSWEGILSFQIHYERDGNPEKRDLRTKFLVGANDKPSGKKILRAAPPPHVPRLGDCQA